MINSLFPYHNIEQSVVLSTVKDRKDTHLNLYSKIPHLTIVGGLGVVVLPDWLPVASMALTTFIDSSSATSPKTTCLPSSHSVVTVVIKNWEPLL